MYSRRNRSHYPDVPSRIEIQRELCETRRRTIQISIHDFHPLKVSLPNIINPICFIWKWSVENNYAPINQQRLNEHPPVLEAGGGRIRVNVSTVHGTDLWRQRRVFSRPCPGGMLIFSSGVNRPENSARAGATEFITALSTPQSYC